MNSLRVRFGYTLRKIIFYFGLTERILVKAMAGSQKVARHYFFTGGFAAPVLLYLKINYSAYREIIFSTISVQRSIRSTVVHSHTP